MILLALILSTIIFLFSLMGYKRMSDKFKGKPIEWVLWLLFVLWILGFTLGGMSFLNSTYPEFNKAIAVIPIVIGFIAFLLINRKSISAGGFDKGDHTSKF